MAIPTELMNAEDAAKGGIVLHTIDIPDVLTETFAKKNGILAVSQAVGNNINLTRPIDKNRTYPKIDTVMEFKTKTDKNKGGLGTVNLDDETISVGKITSRVPWGQQLLEDLKHRVAFQGLQAVVNEQVIDQLAEHWNVGFGGFDNGFVKLDNPVTHTETIASKIADGTIETLDIADFGTDPNALQKAVATAKYKIALASNGAFRADSLVVPSDYQLIEDLNKAELASGQYTFSAYGLTVAEDYTLAPIDPTNDLETGTGARVVALVMASARNIDSLFEASVEVEINPNGFITNDAGAIQWSAAEHKGVTAEFGQWGAPWVRYPNFIIAITSGTGDPENEDYGTIVPA